jgi:hypothetical protein
MFFILILKVNNIFSCQNPLKFYKLVVKSGNISLTHQSILDF